MFVLPLSQTEGRVFFPLPPLITINVHSPLFDGNELVSWERQLES